MAKNYDEHMKFSIIRKNVKRKNETKIDDWESKIKMHKKEKIWNC